MTADNRQNYSGEIPTIKNRLYHTWNNFHRRAYKKRPSVCPEWNRDNPNGYKNFEEWSLANGYTEELTIDRIDNNKGYSPDNCRWVNMKTQNRNRTSNHPITIDGVTYNTIVEAIEALHREADSGTIHSRIQKGMTPQEAFTKPIIEQGQNCAKPIVVNGVQYKSTAEACKALNRMEDYKIIRQRISKYGYTAQEAFDTPEGGKSGHNNDKPITVNGITYKSLAEACRELNREEDYNTILIRITQYGHTADRAFDEPVDHHKPTTVCIDGVEYSNAKEACRALGLSYSAIQTYKLRHHLTYEEAINHYLSKPTV